MKDVRCCRFHAVLLCCIDRVVLLLARGDWPHDATMRTTGALCSEARPMRDPTKHPAVSKLTALPSFIDCGAAHVFPDANSHEQGALVRARTLMTIVDLADV